MNLKSYFQKNSQADLAKALGVTPGAVSQWASGVAEISAERCIEIERASIAKRAASYSDFTPLIAAPISIMGRSFLVWFSCEKHHFTGLDQPTIFRTHRHQSRRTSHSSSDFLLVTLAARGKTLGLWCAGAVGVFYSNSF